MGCFFAKRDSKAQAKSRGKAIYHKKQVGDMAIAV